MSSVPEILGLPPGVHFRPDDDELVEFYLLPRARGEPAPFPGVTVIDDDAAGNTLPWDLLERHGRGGDDAAYFFVRGSADGVVRKPGGARQERSCGGGGTWKSQRRQDPDRVTTGEKVHWAKHNLNLHMGRGGGSVGWVMHEYVLTDPSFPSVKICHVTFTGHGKNRKRLPGTAADDGQSESAPMMKRARVAATAGGSSSSGSARSTTTTAEQDYSCVRSASADHQAPAQAALTDEGISEWVRGLCSDDLQGMAPLAASAADAATEQLVPEHVMMPMVQESTGMEELLEHQYLCGGDEGQQEFLAPMGITPDGFGGASGIGDMNAGAQPAFVNWGGFQFH